MSRSARSLLAMAALTLAATPARPDEPARPAGTANPRATADFENRVRPLLVDRCVKCHGPRKQESNLRLDSRAAMMQGGDSGPAIVPGKPGESLLVRAIRHEGDLQMPPDSRLKAEQVATLSRWIAEGAPWPVEAAGAAIRHGTITAEDRAFWSLRPVRTRTAPEVRDRARVRTVVDRWILAELEARGLCPVGPADRRTLIRRATFDLTGLPPTPEEVAAFLADASPDAFARVVDRLLASPAYGEHWGRHWLDVVRYADTAGETADYPVREAYKYRDYVVAAFNRDMPYDRFVREQIAGDIMAEGADGPAYARMVTATGFLAISRRFGFDSENYHYLTIQDTIDTTGQAFLGLTLGCARCHDHKYDPVSASDYYALYGIFDSTRYPFAGSEQKPNMRSMASLRPHAQTQGLRDSLAWLQDGTPSARPDPSRPIIATLDDIDGDFDLQKPSAGGSLGCLVTPWSFEGRPDVIADAQSPWPSPTGRTGIAGVRFPADSADHRIWQRIWPARSAGKTRRLEVTFAFRPLGGKAQETGSYRFTVGHGPGGSPAVEVFIGASSVLSTHGDSPRPIRPLLPGTWYLLRLTLDLERRTYSVLVVQWPGLGTFSGRKDGTEITDRSLASGWDGTIDTILIDGKGPVAGARPALDVDDITIQDPPIQPVDPPSGTSKRVDGARSLAAQIEQHDRQVTYGVAEGTPHDARIQKRGEPAKPGELVPRRFLEVLGGDPLPRGDEGSGRLELARWLTRPENPLTARVMVNRIWAGHFGTGLVATENDFGRRGLRPTNPGLLDDLAGRFMAGGWSIKAMHRLIMLSSTYQLASDRDTRSAEADPADELLWRFPRRRLEAESIRDAILMLGGGLDRSPGGPHPFPPVGTAFTQHAPFGAVYPSNRRSLYLMTQRIRRHPYLALFDGPDPNSSTAKRSITTVPTQALFFMNDPFVHEQAEGFARRLLSAHPDETSRILLAYRMAMAREPLDDELEGGRTFLERYRQQLGADGIPVGDQSRLSWSAFARTLFASNEFVFVD